jgi:SAM-dependent methyltransferase
MRLCLTCTRTFESGDWRCPSCGAQPSRRDYLSFAPALADGNDSFDAAYFAERAPYEARHFWFRARAALIVWALDRYFPEAKSFLEIGCGAGAILAAIRERRPSLAVAGGELLIEGLRWTHRRVPDATLFQLDARHIPFADEFDVIGAFDVLEHIEQDVDVLSGVFRALRPGGGVMVTVPQHPALWSDSDDHDRHLRRYTRRELIAKLRRAGFVPLRVTSFVSLVLPAMIVARLGRRLGGAPWDPARELEISRVSNELCDRLLTIERRLIAAGVSLPAGGSLLAVARRPMEATDR